jgi:hypothetical protein
MSLASDLLQSSGKKKEKNLSAKEQQPASSDVLGKWYDLNHVVYALIDKHEPDPRIEKQLRHDLRVMQLSGLINEFTPCTTKKVCKEASDVMAQLLRLLPRTR